MQILLSRSPAGPVRTGKARAGTNFTKPRTSLFSRALYLLVIISAVSGKFKIVFSILHFWMWAQVLETNHHPGRMIGSGSWNGIPSLIFLARSIHSVSPVLSPFLYFRGREVRRRSNEARKSFPPSLSPSFHYSSTC